MTGETPGGPPPSRAPDATGRGVRAAVAILAVVTLLHLALLAFVKLSGNSENVWLFIPEGLLVIVAGLAAAIIVMLRLPPDSRAPFWITALVCMFASFIVWAVTCAVAM